MESIEKWTQRVWLVLILSVLAFYISQAGANPATLKPKNEIRVMTIDTGIAPHSKLDSFVQRSNGPDYQDKHGHGTHVAGIVIYGPNMSTRGFRDAVCSNVKLYSCSYEVSKGELAVSSAKDFSRCVKKAIDLQIDYINVSGGGPEFSFNEYLAFKDFTDKGGIVVTSAGNDGKKLNDKFQTFPASYKHGFLYKDSQGILRRAKPLTTINIVQAKCGDSLCPFSNTSLDAETEPGYNVYSTSNEDNGFFFMSGTSQAAPAYLHRLLKSECAKLK